MNLAEQYSEECERSDAAFHALRGPLEFAHVNSEGLLTQAERASLRRLVVKLSRISNMEVA